MTDPVTKVLIEARRLLRERGWCQGQEARDAEGSKCDALDDDAASFCLEGAWVRAYQTADPYAAVEAFDRLSAVIGETGLVDFNDTPGRTFAEIDAALTAAIEGASDG